MDQGSHAGAGMERTCIGTTPESVRDLTMAAIAKRAGVGKPTLYKWWPTKAALNGLFGKLMAELIAEGQRDRTSPRVRAATSCIMFQQASPRHKDAPRAGPCITISRPIRHTEN